jgi:hypothetical protein
MPSGESWWDTHSAHTVRVRRRVYMEAVRGESWWRVLEVERARGESRGESGHCVSRVCLRTGASVSGSVLLMAS